MLASRINTPISTAELERRWSLTRLAMEKTGVDALVLQNSNDWVGGYVKWLTDLPATNGYPRTVIFHADDDMTVVEMGPFASHQRIGEGDPAQRGVGEIFTAPSFASVNYTHDYDPLLALAALKKRSCRRIGLICPGYLPQSLVATLKDGLPNVDFIDLTNEIDAIKAVKSPEELELLRRTAELQDQVFAGVLNYIRPGLRDVDIAAFAQADGKRRGSEQGIYLGASSPLGVRSSFMGSHFQERALQNGDHLSLLIEINGAGGMYTEIARTIVLGKATQQLKDGFARVKEAQDHSLSLMKPGALCRDIAVAHDDWMVQRGLPRENRLYSHGQGYDMVERPLIRADETMRLAEGMCLAVHPGYETPEIFAVICDNYIIGPTGAGSCLHKTDKRIFEV